MTGIELDWEAYAEACFTHEPSKDAVKHAIEVLREDGEV